VLEIAPKSLKLNGFLKAAAVNSRQYRKTLQQYPRDVLQAFNGIDSLHA
jgi:hypothetical protein